MYHSPASEAYFVCFYLTVFITIFLVLFTCLGEDTRTLRRLQVGMIFFMFSMSTIAFFGGRRQARNEGYNHGKHVGYEEYQDKFRAETKTANEKDEKRARLMAYLQRFASSSQTCQRDKHFQLPDGTMVEYQGLRKDDAFQSPVMHLRLGDTYDGHALIDGLSETHQEGVYYGDADLRFLKLPYVLRVLRADGEKIEFFIDPVPLENEEAQ